MRTLLPGGTERALHFAMGLPRSQRARLGGRLDAGGASFRNDGNHLRRTPRIERSRRYRTPSARSRREGNAAAMLHRHPLDRPCSDPRALASFRELPFRRANSLPGRLCPVSPQQAMGNWASLRRATLGRASAGVVDLTAGGEARFGRRIRECSAGFCPVRAGPPRAFGDIGRRCVEYEGMVHDDRSGVERIGTGGGKSR